MTHLRLTTICAALFLSACAAVPNTPRDIANIKLPTGWQHAAPTDSVQIALTREWWKQFNDPELNRLINIALQQNSDLTVAAYNLQKALLQSDLASADLLPKLSASASGSSSKSLEGGASTRSFGTHGGISFQIDLFGKLLKARDARQWLARASAADRQNVELAVTTQTASLYWQLAALNRQITLAETNITQAQQLLMLMRTRYDAGAVARMDVVSAEQNLRLQQSELTTLTHDRHQTRHTLAILLGYPPDARITELSDLPASTPPSLVTELPANVLDHRPDVRAARMRLMADMANVSIAVRDFFPSLNLTANASSSGTHLSDIVTNPIGVLTLNTLLPFLNFPSNTLNLKVSQTQYQANLVQYKNTLYTALSEVENAHSQHTQLTEQYKLLVQNLTAARQLEDMRNVRYREGADALQDLLNAQSNTRHAELALLQNRLALYQNFLIRYTALGGAQ